jgi:SAM-dependent methyltransferase
MPNFNKIVYNLAYRMGKPHWDSGAVPPEVIALAESDHAQTALDLGCGTGTSAIYLAQRGLAVVGVDFTPQAIATARDKARRADVTVDFRIGDVTRLDSLGVHEPFDLALDVGCFHGLDATGRARYAEQLARLTHSGSMFLLWGLDQPELFVKYSVTAEKVQQAFAPNFATSRIEHSTSPSQHAGTWYWLVRQSA